MTGPTFGTRQQLARYIDDNDRLRGGRPAVAAFIDLPPANATNHHLSVNSLEVETLQQIAAYHKNRASPVNGRAALCVHKVHAYNDAAGKAGVPVTYNKNSAKWEFVGYNNSAEEAYRSRPVAPHGYPPVGSPSHCGVEFARAMKLHNALKFARRMTGARFHEL